MTVKITKPELNLREKISELDKPSGVAGEAMLRAETPRNNSLTDWCWRRNILINWRFTVTQRGSYTSATIQAQNQLSDTWLVD